MFVVDWFLLNFANFIDVDFTDLINYSKWDKWLVVLDMKIQNLINNRAVGAYITGKPLRRLGVKRRFHIATL